MRVTTYKSYINESHMNYLVKENSTNYPPVNAIRTVQDIVWIMRDVFHLHELAEETVYMICLNTKNIATAFFVIGKGTVNSCPVGIREICIQALLSSAVHVCLCHNHPSGDISPSEKDIRLTEAVKAALELIGIPLHDHIIIGGDNYFSFSEQKIL